MDIKLVVDSGSDITQQEAASYGVEVIPMSVNDGDREYRDGVDLMPDEIYRRMAAGDVFKTSQIAVATYMEYFEKYAKEKTPMIYLSLSSGLSKTVESAALAGRMLKETYSDFDLTIVDSLGATDGILLLAKAFEDHKEKFQCLQDGVDFLEDLRTKVVHLYSVNDLKYLYRGGRLSKLSFLVGGALNVKPILHVDETGHLKSLMKVRGVKSLISKMVDIFENDMKSINLSKAYVAVQMAMNADLRDLLEQELKTRFGDFPLIRNQLGATIGAHIGPEFVGLYYLKTEK